MDKKIIRSELLSKRDLLSSDKWSEYSKTIEKNILKSNIYKNCKKLLVYMDFHGEVGTMSLIEEALLNGKEVYLPKVHEGFNEARMDFYKISSTFELVDGYKGIMEPISNPSTCFDYENSDKEGLLMLVPGVAFDNKGHRLGYGKGYYDKYLADKEKILTIGLCFSLQVLDEIPTEDTDITLDYIVNEKTSVEEINTFNK